MRRALVLGPLALVTSGCVGRAYGPSDLVATALVPGAVTTHVPTRADVAAMWQLPTESPWAAYEKVTLLAALDTSPHEWPLPDVEAIEEVHRARLAAYSVSSAGLPRDTAWFVDLRGAASVAFAARLGELSPERLAVVPTFNNWPAEGELIPAEETLAAMVRMRPSRIVDPSARPMFLLDSWRLAYKEEEIDEETTDNRYALTTSDVPSAEKLLAQGIHRVLYVTSRHGDDAHEEDDLNEAFSAYEAAGIEIAIVGIDDLVALPEEGWDARCLRWRIVVVPRAVILTSASFHGRAHGGFGGVHAAPGHGWFGGHGGG